jgi:hypothetical protein
MTSTEIRDRRRTLRYRSLLMKQTVQMKNRISGLLMETGVSYNKQRLHKVGYFSELLSTNEEVNESIRSLLKLSRETIARSGKIEYALISSGTRPLAGRQAQAAENHSRSRSDHCPDMGPGDRRCFTLPDDQAGHQLLRTLRRGKELRRQGDAHTSFQTAQQAYPAGFWWKPRNWRPDRTMSWPWSMKEKSREETAIARRSPWRGRWSPICSP